MIDDKNIAFYKKKSTNKKNRQESDLVRVRKKAKSRHTGPRITNKVNSENKIQGQALTIIWH